MELEDFMILTAKYLELSQEARDHLGDVVFIGWNIKGHKNKKVIKEVIKFLEYANPDLDGVEYLLDDLEEE